MLRILKNDGMASFLEVITAASIFLVASFGIYTAISALSPHAKESNKRLEAARLAKNMISQLHLTVNANSWDDCGSVHSSDLSLCPGTYIRTIGDYTVKWTVTQESSGARKVKMEISYIE